MHYYLLCCVRTVLASAVYIDTLVLIVLLQVSTDILVASLVPKFTLLCV